MLNPISAIPMSNDELNVYKAVTSKYLNTNYNNNTITVKSNNCKDLDVDAKQILDELVVLRKSQDKQTNIDFLMFANKLVLDKFNSYDCRNRIEDTRLDDAGNVNTKYSIKSEQSVIGKSNSETNIYLIIGGLVIISTLAILLTNKK